MKARGKNRLERNDRLVRLALLVVAFSAVSASTITLWCVTSTYPHDTAR